MTYTEQLELESDKVRRDLAESLQELRTRISPGQMVDQLVEYARDGSRAEFVRNLKRQAVNNPLPVMLIGTGVAWLMLGGAARARDHSSVSRLADRAGDAFQGMGQSIANAGEGARTAAIADTASRLHERAGDMASSTYESASSALNDASQRARNTATSTYDKASSALNDAAERAANTTAAVADSARNLGRNAVETSKSFVDFCRDQPLVLAGIGVAMGALLGAIPPSTEAEGRLMGEASDAVKSTVKDFAADTVEKTAAVGEHAVEAAKDAAREQGLTGPANDTAAAEPVTSDMLSEDARPLAHFSSAREQFHEGVDASSDG
jgi:ElaB/YqjD/DUF883 family membrane-anchored ribosome-binding protein